MPATDSEALRDAKSPPMPDMSACAQTFNWLFRPLAFMERAQQQLGDVFGVRVLGWAKLVLVSDPSLIREVFATDAETLKPGEANDLMGPVLGRHSVFLLDGAEHRQIRRALVNAFNLETARRAAEFSRQRAIEIVGERCDGRLHDVHRIFGEIALGTMLELLFHSSERWMTADYYQHFRFILGGASAFLAYLRFLQKDLGPATPGWWFHLNMRVLHRAIERDLTQACAAHSGAPAQEISESMRTLNLPDADRAARDQIISLIVAGHDTVASAMSWCLFGLLQRPDIIDKLREELGTSVDMVAIEKLRLLEATCLEALRLTPTVEIVSRRATRDMRLGRYRISKGDFLSPCVYLLHRRPSLYPNAAEFRPERFLDRQFAAHEFIPFGGGMRRCLGATLGLLEMKAVIATLIMEFDFHAPRLSSVRARRRNVTIAPSPKFRAIFRRRNVLPGRTADAKGENG